MKSTKRWRRPHRVDNGRYAMKLSEKLKDPSWKAALEPEFQKPYFIDLQIF
jgi:hypothetical protein